MMSELTQGKPISWRDVAIVVFDGDKPVIITSAEPHVLFDTFQSLVDVEDERGLFGELNNNRPSEILGEIAKLRWELHPTEQAKKLFCKQYAEEHEPGEA